MKNPASKLEYRIILDWIEQSSSVLDLGCGDGGLTTLLVQEKEVRAQGIEIDEKAIHECVTKGLSVFQEDVDTGLAEYLNKSFAPSKNAIEPSMKIISATQSGYL